MVDACLCIHLYTIRETSRKREEFVKKVNGFYKNSLFFSAFISKTSSLRDPKVIMAIYMC